MGRPDVTDAVKDPRMPPLRYYIALGVLVGASLSLTRVHVAYALLIPAGCLLAWPLLRRGGYGVKDERSVIALNAPLPGTMAPMLVPILLLPALLQLALRVPATTAAVVAFQAGVIIVAALAGYGARLSTLRMIAGVRELEQRGA